MKKSCLTNSVTFHNDVTGLVDENSGKLPIIGFSKAFDTAFQEDPHRETDEIRAG